MTAPSLKLVPKSDDKLLLNVLRDSPLARKAITEHEAATFQRRSALVADIEKLDNAAAREIPPLQAAVDSALAEFTTAQNLVLQNVSNPHGVAALMIARGKLDAARDKAVAASLTYSSRRDRLEHELRQTACPAIKLFKSELLTAFAAARRAPLVVRSSRVRSIVAGKSITTATSNAASIAARMAAIREAMHAADLMEIEPDQRDVDARLEKMRQALPAIDG
jgi:hypothetical protein